MVEEQTETTLTIPLPVAWSQASSHSLRLVKAQKDAYYRSRIFTAHAGINPLITAASPLLVLLERFKGQQSELSYEAFAEQLKYEFNAFEKQALANNYSQETIVMAQHLLQACFEEFLANTWFAPIINMPKLEHYQFFSIVERLQAEPKKHLELLELSYLCLSMGYQGEYKKKPQAKVQLDRLIEALYQTIHRSREQRAVNLPIKIITYEKQKAPISLHKLGLVIALLVSLVFAVNFSLSYVLDLTATPLYHQVFLMTEQLQNNTIFI